MLKVLRNRNFSLLWFGQLISGSGDWLRNMALLYWVFAVTKGEQPMATAAITIASTAPALLFGVAAGALADRWDRRRTLIGSDLLRGILCALQIVSVLQGSLLLAYLIAFASSAVQQVYDPARGALIPSIVPKDDLLAASAVRQATQSGLLMAGAALGTGVYFALGPMVSFAVGSSTFLVSALLNVALRVPAIHSTGQAVPSFWSQVKDGLAYARGSAFVRNLITLGLMAMGAGGAIQVVDLYLVTRDLQLPQANVAWLTTAMGISMAAGYMLVGLVSKGLKRLDLLATAGIAVAGLGVLVMALSPNLAVAIAGIVVMGLGTVTLNAGFGPLIQTHVAREYLGRVIGTFQSLTTAAMLISISLAGYLAGMLSARWILGTASLLLLVTAAVAGAGLQRSIAPAPIAAPEATSTPVNESVHQGR